MLTVSGPTPGLSFTLRRGRIAARAAPTAPAAGGMRVRALRLPMDGSTDVRIFARRVRCLCPVGAPDSV